jgi:hypothetical protein
MDDNLKPEQWHKKEAIENFNATWDLIDKSHRTHDENLSMVHMAHASRFHWGQIGEPVHLARGEWQISRVYSLLNMAESALLHAEESLRICEDNNIGDFDLAFAYEALARAYGILKDSTHLEFFRKKASAAADAIKDKGNKEYLLSELENIE